MEKGERTYWQRFALRRASRRGVVVGSVAAGLGAASLALVGCGGGDEDASREGAGSQLAKRKDTTESAKPGGTYQDFTTTDTEGWDPIAATTNATRGHAAFAYSRLMKWKTGKIEPAKGEIDGDLVESWELSADATQLTLKLRQNARWDARAPTNGRAADSQDIVFSFKRFKELSPFRTDWFNDLNAFGPISEVQAPDAKTVVLKLAYPFGALYQTLANTLGFWPIPREADGGFDPKKEARGAGPWLLEKYEPSVGFEWKRNPTWSVKDRPFLAGWSQPIVTEYATQLAQFRAGNIWGGVVNQQDIIATKRDIPRLLMFQGDYGAAVPHIFFGWLNPIFRDERVRRAMSMLIDRETFADVFSDSEAFRKEGIDLGIVYDNILGAGWGDYWLDPFSKDAGESGQYYKFNVAEAKKLLAAAGHPNGFETVHFNPSGAPYGAIYDRRAQTFAGMLNEGGIKVTFKEVGYRTDFVPNYIYTMAFDGISSGPGGLSGGPVNDLRTKWHSDSVVVKTPYAPSTVGKAGGPKDTLLDSMIDSLVREGDYKKSVSLAHDVQRHVSKMMYYIPFSYQARSLSLTWPWVGNAGVYRPWLVSSAPTDLYPSLWYDAAQRKA